jgi:hypothetical protein
MLLFMSNGTRRVLFISVMSRAARRCSAPRRRLALAKWWEAAALLQKMGLAESQALEERMWREKRLAVRASPSRGVRDSMGQLVVEAAPLSVKVAC